MRTINEIIIHCSATPEGRDYDAATIRRWHTDRGFQDIGYHYIVRLDGTVETGRPEEQTGAHCRGHNTHSIGICYIGGLAADGKPKDTRTTAQRQALAQLCRQLKKRYPQAGIHPHNEYANKACPCFDVKAEFGDPDAERDRKEVNL